MIMPSSNNILKFRHRHGKGLISPYCIVQRVFGTGNQTFASARLLLLSDTNGVAPLPGDTGSQMKNPSGYFHLRPVYIKATGF